MSNYKDKYNKYKSKYIELKKMIGGNYNMLKIDENPTDSQFIEFGKILKSREQNWLIFFSGFTTTSEKIRFNNINWIFYNWTTDESRISIKGTINLDNIKKLCDKFPNSFDYICFDWRIDNIVSSGEEFMSLINNLFILLKKGGKIYINNYENIIDSDIEDDTSIISKINSLGAPLGEGSGGKHLINKIFSLIQKIKERYEIIFDDTNFNFIKILKSKMFLGIDNLSINKFYEYMCYLYYVSNSSKNCELFKNNYNLVKTELETNTNFFEGLINDLNNLLIYTTKLWRMPNILDKNKDDEKNTDLLIEKKNDLFIHSKLRNK